MSNRQVNIISRTESTEKFLSRLLSLLSEEKPENSVPRAINSIRNFLQILNEPELIVTPDTATQRFRKRRISDYLEDLGDLQQHLPNSEKVRRNENQ